MIRMNGRFDDISMSDCRSNMPACGLHWWWKVCTAAAVLCWTAGVQSADTAQTLIAGQADPLQRQTVSQRQRGQILIEHGHRHIRRQGHGLKTIQSFYRQG